jgi:acyl carrier protein
MPKVDGDDNLLEVIETIKQLVVKLSGFKGRVEATEPLKTYGIDSLMNVELIISIEEGFNISIPDKYLTAECFKTVKSISEMINKIILESRVSK